MGQIRSWSQVPRDPQTSSVMYDFLVWVQTSLNSIIGQIQPLTAPGGFTLAKVAGGVRLTWNEVAGAASYNIFESTTATQPSTPLATVPANLGGVTNSFLRSGINDTVVRFYAVRAVTRQGVAGTLSSFLSSSSGNVNTVNQASGTTSSPTQGSITLAVIPQMTITATFTGKPVLLLFTCQIQTDTANGLVGLAFFRDGVNILNFLNAFVTANTDNLVSMQFVDTPAAGSHTYDVRWNTNGTVVAKADGTERVLQVIQLS